MTAVAQDTFVDDRLAKRNAVLLALAQALGGASASIVITTGSLVGYMMLDEDKALATVPVSAMVLGTAFGTIPAGIIMRRFGRRAGFMGSAIGRCCLRSACRLRGAAEPLSALFLCLRAGVVSQEPSSSSTGSLPPIRQAMRSSPRRSHGSWPAGCLPVLSDPKPSSPPRTCLRRSCSPEPMLHRPASP
jgi:hypothetical protein